MARKICFVGFAAGSREWANNLPLDEGWEIWGTNECHLFLKGYDRWFQIHPKTWENNRAEERKIPDDCYGRQQWHVDWLATCEGPVYQQAIDERIPNSTLYPYDEVAALRGGSLFLTSTLSYMAALAVLEQTQKGDIDGWTSAGIELSLGTEYYFQREAFAYWIGRLEGMGVEWIRPPSEYTTQLFAEPVYAKSSNAPMAPMTSQAIYDIQQQKGGL